MFFLILVSLYSSLARSSKRVRVTSVAGVLLVGANDATRSLGRPPARPPRPTNDQRQLAPVDVNGHASAAAAAALVAPDCSLTGNVVVA